MKLKKKFMVLFLISALFTLLFSINALAEEKVPLYSNDGRIHYTLKSEVNLYKSLGWHDTCPLIGKTFWVSQCYYIYLENNKVIDDSTPCWETMTISGYDENSLTSINENVKQINQLYFWKNNIQLKVPLSGINNGYLPFYGETTNKLLDWKCPKIEYNISDSIWNNIQNWSPCVGMNKTEFSLINILKPQNINTTTTDYGTHEQWIYGSSNIGFDYYYFDNGFLTGWSLYDEN